MKVIAVAEGYDNVKVRQPGEEFEMPDGSVAEWFKSAEPIEQAKSSKAARAEKSAGDTA